MSIAAFFWCTMMWILMAARIWQSLELKRLDREIGKIKKEMEATEFLIDHVWQEFDEIESICDINNIKYQNLS